MSIQADPLGSSQDEQLKKSDLFVVNMGRPEVASLIDPADSAAATLDNTNLHRDKLADDQAKAASKETTKVKNNTFGAPASGLAANGTARFTGT